MRKSMLAVFAMTAMMFVVPSVASATNDTPPPGNGPPELCDLMPWLPQCDGGGTNVTVDEATEEECPAGGWVIVLGETRYPVCNGTDGSDGEDGQDGSNGEDGQDGTNGENGQNGVDGANGSDGTAGTNGRNGLDGTTQVVVPDQCVSTRTAKLRIKKNRGDRVRGLTARLHGKKLTLNKRNKRTWTAKVPLAGLPQGVWAVHIKYRLNGKVKRQVHLYRTCIDYDVNETGLNARPIVRL
jgi:hypothetical protein